VRISGKFRRPRIRRSTQQGYILLTLMLFVALLAIGAAVVAPSITFQVRRDREEELIHRGTQYSRAVRRYFKKFGRFPVRLEELDNTNNMRFLRKRYKDPITGQDFKVLHLNEVKLNFGAGLVGVNPPGVPTLGGAAMQNPALVAAAAGAMANTQSNINLNPAQAGGDNSSSSPNSAQGSSGNARSSGNPGSPANPSSGPFSGPTFGGGPIVGVVSTSEKDTIREFNKKNHYNQWQFIYDPGSDRGGLLNTPAQPPLQNAVQTVQPGAAVQPGMQGVQAQPVQVQPAPPQ